MMGAADGRGDDAVFAEGLDQLVDGAQYGMWHSLALLVTMTIPMRAPGRLPTVSAALFAAGILLFSGTLFARALLDWAWISKATPLGGMCFIAGWLLLAAHGATLRRE